MDQTDNTVENKMGQNWKTVLVVAAILLVGAVAGHALLSSDQAGSESGALKPACQGCPSGSTCAAQAQPAADTEPPPEIEPEALRVLQAMATKLVATDEFGYRVESNYDAVQDSGIKVEYGASRKLMVSRPDRMRMESERRDGNHSILVMDGNNIWAHMPELDVYATTEQPGDLDESLDFVVRNLRVKAPLPALIT